MTFEEFESAAFEICQAINPDCFVRVERGNSVSRGAGPKTSWYIATDAIPPVEGCTVWFCYCDTPEQALAKLRAAVEANSFDTPEYRREVAEAMGLLK